MFNDVKMRVLFDEISLQSDKHKGNTFFIQFIL